MSLNTAAVFAALESLCLATGLFRQVNTHEPKRPPDGDLTAAVWLAGISPVDVDSGLAMSSARSEFTIRIYTQMLQEHPDAIDPTVMTATDTIMTDLTGDFTLGGTVQHVDLLGRAGVPLSSRTGYLDIGGTMYRIMDIIVPCIISDAWSQTP